MNGEMATFAKISAKLYLNEKVQVFAERHGRAAFLWISAITFCVDRRNDGHVSKFEAKRFLGARQRDLDALCEAGLFEPVEDGWMIHDFCDAQVSTDRQEEIREKRREAARKRWGSKEETEEEPQNINDSEASKPETLTLDVEETPETGDASAYANAYASAHANADANAMQVHDANGMQMQCKPDAEIETETELETETDIKYSPPNPLPGFEKFWYVYPNHDDKYDAIRAYNSIRRRRTERPSLEALVEGAQKLADSADDPRYIPKASKWLANGGWMNEPKPKPKHSSPAQERQDRHLQQIAMMGEQSWASQP